MGHKQDDLPQFVLLRSTERRKLGGREDLRLGQRMRLQASELRLPEDAWSGLCSPASASGSHRSVILPSSQHRREKAEATPLPIRELTGPNLLTSCVALAAWLLLWTSVFLSVAWGRSGKLCLLWAYEDGGRERKAAEREGGSSPDSLASTEPWVQSSALPQRLFGWQESWGGGKEHTLLLKRT